MLEDTHLKQGYKKFKVNRKKKDIFENSHQKKAILIPSRF